MESKANVPHDLMDLPQVTEGPSLPRPASVLEKSRHQGESQRDSRPGGELRIAYIMSRFPKLTETFVLYELKALEANGVSVELFPLWRERCKVMHPEAQAYVARAFFTRVLSFAVLQANLRRLLRSPAVYCATLWCGLRANWGSLRYWLGFLAIFPKAVYFAEAMQRREVQQVHAHFASHPAAAAWIIRRLTGIPYSFTAHGSDLHRDVHMLREKVEEAALVVAISRFNRDKILDESGREYRDKVRVIHCGTDLAVFHPRTPQPSAPSQTALQIACVGTLHEVKGQRFLVEACRRLKEQNVPFRLHLVGSGPDHAALNALAKQYCLADCIVFYGNLTRTGVAELLHKMDVAVAPSVPTRDGRKEGIPVALMEAMACRLPVVASRLTGIPELVEDRVSGRLVPPGDSAAIAEALAELARRPDLRTQWGGAARQTIETRFDLERNAQILLQEFRQIGQNDSHQATMRRREVA